MLKNTLINRMATKTIAEALGELNQRVVYVGGAVVSLYIDDEAADDVRPTKDIDITLEIANVGELEKVREYLNAKGFTQSPEDHVMCRFRFNDIKVDVMATEEVGWAPANEWFAPGFAQREQVELDEVIIHRLPFAYYLATKFAAFNDRGGEDPRTSKDFEDISYLFNYMSDIYNLINQADPEVKAYLKAEFQKILDSDTLQEGILAHMYYEDQEHRFNKIMNLLRTIVAN